MNQEEQIKHTIMLILAPHIGFESRIPRRLLLMEINRRLSFRVSDRRMRDTIEALRVTKKGKYICASIGAKGGYFLAQDDKELDKFTQPDLNRAYTTIRRVTTQRKLAGLESSPQIRMF